MTNTSPKIANGSKVDAGAAGAGGGTMLVLLANNLPADSPWKSWLVIIAPSLSVGISALWFWAKQKIQSYYAIKAIEDAIDTVNKVLDNHKTSDAHKEELKKELEKLEKILLQLKVNKANVALAM
jgi:hypothetical protein